MENTMDRRQSLKWLGGLGAFLLPVAASGPSWAGAQATPGSPLSKPKAEWADLLPAASYRVLFEEDTERAGSSPLNQEKRDGTFICAACYLPLFDSSTKYESGTGWPSFWQHLPGAVSTKTDFKIFYPRTEYHCARCGGHQGHIFNDGPKPTGKRFCNNGVALQFVARSEKLPELRT
jgi:peptide-methionine (R)-S-oxide reductase